MQNSILDVCETLTLGKNNELNIDFIGKGNIWIKNTYNSDVIALARYIIHEAIQKTALGQIIITGLDSDYSGLFAPFATLASGASKQLELLGSFKDLESHLDFLGQHIQAVQNVIQGRNDSLTAFRQSIDRPVESYRLIVLFLNLSMVDLKFLAKLSTLMQRGPASGVSFLIIPANNIINGDRTPHQLDKNICTLSADGSKAVSLTPDGKPQIFAEFTPYRTTDIIAGCERFAQRVNNAALPVVHFNEVNNVEQTWNRTSENGLTFTVGKYGVNDVEITIGDEINQRHNALITGAVGQGKSNLISVIIHSLCQRYSPRELNLYLLDFKEGVSLKPYANIGQEEYLPHAKVVGLESDIALGSAVLEYLYGEYLRRLKLFKERNVKNLKDFRAAYPNEEMPRVLAIIDEFQLMFGDDMSFGQKIVDLLEKSVRLFRAAGIHFILASQSISGNMVLSSKKDSIFSQVPIRIAHKNSVTESQNTLGISNSAAAYLRAREAIVNLDYGEISQNRKTVIAWANEEVLKPLRRKWWESGQANFPAPYVFDSEKKTLASNAADDIRLFKSTVPTALLGEKISITGEKLAIPLPGESGRNIAIVGSPDAECNNGEGIIQSIALSIAAGSAQKNFKFYFCDFRDKELPIQQRFPSFAGMLQSSGLSLIDIPRSQFQATLNELLEQPEAEPGGKSYIFALGLDRWNYEKDDFGTPPLKTFVDAAPEKGIHFIGWWVKPSKFKAQVSGYEGSDAFNTKVFLRVDEGSVRALTNNPFIKWEAAENRALLSDEVEFSNEVVFIPYSPIS
ncbi:MAG: hypothetical protein LBT44_02805 [Clostridiales bacterium]|jgi:hypothetical protein|nr:hypothetical protein [Clostridiales bacterium]